ncbi:hypothetical protein F5Y04DRAFT_271584 [Hypomontagnella monticulosa]|nr:hypothetical protein F5Y04DRAFT_271584 [Hypomontagnella monticulosa]
MPPLPPPPPPPPNPWFGRKRIPRESLISRSIWPHRLLHVETMTSHIRQGDNTYGSVREPVYNVLSYTWGRFMDRTLKETSLVVHGIDWPIPPIQKSHFSAITFQDAIHHAANGYRHSCEWLWVDIACIPQEHDQETQEAARIRDQEISRQVEIFYRAKEAFAWLSSLRELDLFEDLDKLLSIDEFISHYRRGLVDYHNAELAAKFLDTVEEHIHLLLKPMTTMLNHPWFDSLWTLQEMVLRPDALILLDDGVLKAGDKWDIHGLKTDILTLRFITHNPKDIAHILTQVELISDGIGAPRSARMVQKLEQLITLQKLKGLEALDIEFPNTAYSLAQHRQVSKLEDRIHGIVQTYGISCGPLPPGGDPISRLHTLEDEFGEKLVAKSPVLSQLFIHSGEEHPRKSWLITQKCRADDLFWVGFFQDGHVLQTLYDCLEVVSGPGHDRSQGNYLRFVGKAWYLDEFLESSPKHYNTFRSADQETAYLYRGLMLDHYISKSVLSNIVEYFPNRQSMLDAVQKLYQYYRTMRGHQDSAARRDEISALIKIALLASESDCNLPAVQYVGIVLAPASTDQTSMATTTWKRIGLMRWTEHYYEDEPPVHQELPPYHELEALIA